MQGQKTKTLEIKPSTNIQYYLLNQIGIITANLPVLCKFPNEGIKIKKILLLSGLDIFGF